MINIDELHHPEKYQIAREELVEVHLDPRLSEAYLESSLHIWFVKDHDKFELPEDEYGIFYDKLCYIIKYSVRTRGGDVKHAVYYWQGRKSSTEDRGTSSLLATEVTKGIGRSSLVRVVQNKEPEHFLSHFLGIMVVRKGTRETWDSKSTALYIIRGTNAFDTIAVQTKTGAFSLNSNDCFVLDTPNTIYIWEGEGSNEFERKNAVECSQNALENSNSKQHIQVKEGSEPEEFWQALGGKGEYRREPRLLKGDLKGRLFQCSDKTGVFKVFEIFNFTQDDLDNDDVMLLDAFEEVFVWVGKNASKREREMANQVAKDYIKQSDDGRNQDSPVYIVEAGAEPLEFTVFFHGWDDEVARSGEDIYERKLKQLHLESNVVGGVTHTQKETTNTNDDIPKSTGVPKIETGGLIIPFEKLKIKNLRPQGIDEGSLEVYLSDQEFESVLKMNRSAFYEQPKWKQLRIKKSAGLF